jgi:hypothetical protein
MSKGLFKIKSKFAPAGDPSFVLLEQNCGASCGNVEFIYV